jgi:hypothetical protein
MSIRLLTLAPALPFFATSLLLAGCADRFTVPGRSEAPDLVGAISGGQARPGVNCDPMQVELVIVRPAQESHQRGNGDDPVGLLAGRAYPAYVSETRASGWSRTLQPWWLEGDLYENGTAVVTLYQSTMTPTGPSDALGAKPFSVFRGTFVGNRLDAAEQVPLCDRRLVAEAAGTVIP